MTDITITTIEFASIIVSVFGLGVLVGVIIWSIVEAVEDEKRWRR